MRRFFTETSDGLSGSLLYPLVDPNNSYRRNSRCKKELTDQGKIYTLGKFQKPEKIYRKSAQSPLAYSGTERYSVMYKLLIIVSGNLKEPVGLVGGFSALANGFLTCTYDEDCIFKEYRLQKHYAAVFFSGGIVENQKLIEWLKIIAAEKNATRLVTSSGVDVGKNPFLVPIPGTRNSKRLDRKYSAESIHPSAEEVTETERYACYILMS